MPRPEMRAKRKASAHGGSGFVCRGYVLEGGPAVKLPTYNIHHVKQEDLAIK